jgi:hypothetical protein
LLPAISAFGFGYGFEGGSGGYNSAATGGGTPFGITFISDATLSTVGTTYTFTSQAIGTADPTRLVVVGIGHGVSGRTVTSATIGGISATQATGAQPSGSGSNTDIWYAAVPTGTTATIVINYSGSEDRTAIAVYSVIGTGLAFSAANGTTISSGTPTSVSTTVITPSGGVVAVAITHVGAITAITGSNLTSDISAGLPSGSSGTLLAGHDTSHSGSTAYGFSWTTGVADVNLSVASFSP